MAKAVCPAGCGQKYISKEHAERHADADHPDWRTPKSKGWATPYGFIDFREPVTYEHACAVMKPFFDEFKNASGGQTEGIESIGKPGVHTLQPTTRAE